MDDYSDLPEWIRPGNRVAEISGGTVQAARIEKITKTQIVVTCQHNAHYSSQSRYNREPITPYHGKPEWRRRGGHWGHLAPIDDPYVVKELRLKRLAYTFGQIREQIQVWDASNPNNYRHKDTSRRERTEELGMELLDEIENIVRKTVRGLMAAPGAAGQNDRAAVDL